MLFNKIDTIHSLLIANTIESCKEDVKIMKSLFLNSKVCIDCNTEKEVYNFCNNKKFNKNDLLIIHYSGHGEKIGKKINGKMSIISTWINNDIINNDVTQTHSDTIDSILSKLNCQILLISDSCYSGNFGNFYKGNSRLVYIGSSSINHISKEYIINFDKKTGVLACLFEEILKKYKLDEITVSEFINLSEKFFNKNRIKIKPIIKIFDKNE